MRKCQASCEMMSLGYNDFMPSCHPFLERFAMHGISRRKALRLRRFYGAN
jgi:hypothetical protein